jgi:glycine/D-amino acid oxidase-like deaminating enzyme
MNSKTNSILIVGSGLAGSTLAMELAQRGVHVVLIDNQFPQSSSRVAAGLLNPIVPKGVRKTWQCDTLFPALYDYYTHWEKALDAKFIHRYPFLNLHANANETHEWNKQRENASMAEWLSKAAPDDFNQLPFEDATWVNHCGRLDVKDSISPNNSTTTNLKNQMHFGATRRKNMMRWSFVRALAFWKTPGFSGYSLTQRAAIF